MTDKKPTDNEIVKALECCKNDGIICGECPYKKANGCMEKLSADALDLINRQNAEIERLKEEVGLLHSDYTYKFVKAKAKAEAYKEFWNIRPERLNEQYEGKEEYNKGWNACLDEFWEMRNNLLKELVGEK